MLIICKRFSVERRLTCKMRSRTELLINVRREICRLHLLQAFSHVYFSQSIFERSQSVLMVALNSRVEDIRPAARMAESGNRLQW